MLQPVESGAGRGEGVLVDVGGIDLHIEFARVLTQLVCDQHRERVRLLARGAAGAPDAEALVRGRLFDQPGQHRLPHLVPRLGVAEEARDVDQDDVEEGLVLVGVAVEVVDVGGEAGHVELRHPMADAAEERKLLVLAEVEVVFGVELLEQTLELRVRDVLGGAPRPAVACRLFELVDLVAHRFAASAPSGWTRRTMAGPMSSSSSLKSTQPVAYALAGMPG